MNILILGAGVIGVTSAWYLRQAGHEVTVIERQSAAAQETSFANGGQISVSHAEPWANPRAIPQALAWMGREDAPLLFRFRPFDFALHRWALSFAGHCLPGKTRANIRAITRLALHSREELVRLRQSLGNLEKQDFNLVYDGLQKGILHFYTDEKVYARAQESARLMREFGLEREPVDAQGCARIEPALSNTSLTLAGGDYTARDESGDACLFTQALAERSEQKGVRFAYNAEAESLLLERGAVCGVRLRDGRIFLADRTVMALGSFSAPFLRPYGLYLPIYPAKGYSVTLDLPPNSGAPSVSLTDDEHKLVFSRLGNRLRIAGTAEFNGYDQKINPARCNAVLERALRIFPRLTFEGEPRFWCGLRPATPSNVPILGPAALPGLWLNTGHGTLGWTMSCGSAELLSRWISDGKRPPELAFS
ncbi:MAG: D-amino acid dehydrogenase [Zoogloeaceae bacterium]|jgi:D-amino-acid dehydrogenase|nr:D-amino acid dehydrogenase [Zoogloeaceae bacterium]